MKNKKKVILLGLTSVLSASLLAVTLFANFDRSLFFSKADVPYSCEYYFDEDNGYTSLYELNKTKIDNGSDINSIKTWGTVTCNYTNSGLNVAIIQSTDKNGHLSAATVYGVDQYPIGSMVTAVGRMSAINGLSQIKDATLTLNKSENPYPPELFLLNSVPDSDDDNFDEYRYMGARKVKITNAAITSVNNNDAYAQLTNGDEVLLYFNYVSTKTAIKNRINELRAQGNLDVTGYLAYNAGYFQIWVRDPNDVTQTIQAELVINNYEMVYFKGDSFITPQVKLVESNGTETDVTSECTFTGFDSSTVGFKRITVTYQQYSTYFDVYIVRDPDELHRDSELVYFEIDNPRDTGNYGENSFYEYYRAVPEEVNLCKLLPLESRTSVDTLGGSLLNTTRFPDIDYVDIVYSTNKSSGSNAPRLYYGENNYDDGYIQLSYSTSLRAELLDLNSYNANWFRLDSGDAELTLNLMVCHYSGDTTPHGSEFTFKNANYGQERIAPTVYSGELVDGVSSVSVPISFNKNTGTITSTYTYTYYSYEYVAAHPDCADDAAMTSSIDVANYFMAFGCAPANYGGSGDTKPSAMRDGKELPSVSQVNSLFGNDARRISEYHRDDGYLTAVPFYGTTPTYYEFDIDVTGTYTTSNRSVGRLVGISTGFDVADYGYGSQPVCLYTDDHYATFCEYNNCFEYMPRFNAERYIAGAVWSLPTTYAVHY